MALYDPDRNPTVDPADAAVVAHRFLTRCRDWARDREIPRRLEQVAEDMQPTDAASLHAWTAWMRFCEHALREIEDGTLDPWFLPPDSAPEPSTSEG